MRPGLRLGAFLYLDAKLGARCPHCGQRCRPLQFATGTAPELSILWTTPHDELIAICDKRTKGRLSSCDKLSQLAPCRASEFRTSKPKRSRPNFGLLPQFRNSCGTERRCVTGLYNAILGVFSPALVFFLWRCWSGFCGRWRGLHCCVLFLNVKTVDIF